MPLSRTLSATEATTHCSVAFGAYVTARAAVIAPLLAHYENKYRRKLRWKGRVEGERSVAKFVQRIKDMGRDGQQTVVAWGAWGAIARTGQINRGKPTCLGVGLMKRVVARCLG